MNYVWGVIGLVLGGGGGWVYSWFKERSLRSELEKEKSVRVTFEAKANEATEELNHRQVVWQVERDKWSYATREQDDRIARLEGVITRLKQEISDLVKVVETCQTDTAVRDQLHRIFTAEKQRP